MQTLRRLRSEERNVTNEIEYNKRVVFDADIKESLGDYITPAPLKPAREYFDKKTLIMMKMMTRPLGMLCLRMMLLIKLVKPFIRSLLLI